MSEEIYTKMNDEEKIPIREINEEGYRMENEIPFREINEEGYRMENEIERKKRREEKRMREEKRKEERMREEKRREEIKNKIKKIEEEIKNKKIEKRDRKLYENDKVEYKIKNIYKKYGLYENNKLLSLDKLEKLINKINAFNYRIEKNEYLNKKEFKNEICVFKIEGLEREKRERKIREERERQKLKEIIRLKKIIGESEIEEENEEEYDEEWINEGEDLLVRREIERERERGIEREREERGKRRKKILENISKNEFIIPKKYKNKKSIAKYIRKLFKEYKWLETSYYSFLITKNFTKFNEIKKIKLNRNGVVKCYNEENKILCIYFFFLNNYFYKIKKYFQIEIQLHLDIINDGVDNVDDVDNVDINENINIDNLISFDQIVLEKECFDDDESKEKIIEKRI